MGGGGNDSPLSNVSLIEQGLLVEGDRTGAATGAEELLDPKLIFGGLAILFMATLFSGLMLRFARLGTTGTVGAESVDVVDVGCGIGLVGLSCTGDMGGKSGDVNGIDGIRLCP